MTVPSKNITLTIQHAGSVTTVHAYPHEYRNLMVLLVNNIYTEHFGECGGQGRCATCLVRVTEACHTKNPLSRNEEVTLSRLGIHSPNVRLACQFLVTEDIDGSEIEVLEEAC